MAAAKPRPKPRQFTNASGDFLAFMEDIKRKDTKTITIGDQTFHILGPSLMSDDAVESLSSDDVSVVDKARAVIDDYAGFAAAGGTAMLLMTYYDSVFKADAEGEDPASSSS